MKRYPVMQNNISSSVSQVQTIDRVYAILNCFSRREPYLGLTEISTRIELPKSTTHRLVSSMEHHGFLVRAPDGRRYALGYQFLRWASIVETSLDLREQARPLLEKLSNQSDETAVLTVRDGDWAVCLDKVDSSRPVRLEMTVGKRINLHAGSSAKMLMAYLEPEEIERIIREIGLPKLEENTITDPQRLREELAHIRAVGYAISFEERDPEAAGVTAPVFNSHHQVVAALGIVGPISRITPDRIPEFVKLVTQFAQQFSIQLGMEPT